MSCTLGIHKSYMQTLDFSKAKRSFKLLLEAMQMRIECTRIVSKMPFCTSINTTRERWTQFKANSAQNNQQLRRNGGKLPNLDKRRRATRFASSRVCISACAKQSAGRMQFRNARDGHKSRQAHKGTTCSRTFIYAARWRSFCTTADISLSPATNQHAVSIRNKAESSCNWQHKLGRP